MGIESTGCLKFATGEEEMKKLLLLCLLLSLSTGCGRGWMPCLFRGASCGNGGCIGTAPALPQGCNACVGGTSAGYGGYDGEVIGGEIVSDSYYGGNTYGSGDIGAPALNGTLPMAPIQKPAP